MNWIALAAIVSSVLLITNLLVDLWRVKHGKNPLTLADIKNHWKKVLDPNNHF